MTDPLAIQAELEAKNDIIRSQLSELDSLRAENDELRAQVEALRGTPTLVPPSPRDGLGTCSCDIASTWTPTSWQRDTTAGSGAPEGP